MPKLQGALAFLRPRDDLTPRDRTRTLDFLYMEGATSSASASFTSGAMLTAFALALGASSFEVGLLSSIPAIMQVLQPGFLLLIERARVRKAFAVPLNLLSYYGLAIVAMAPLLFGVPSGAAVLFILTVLAVRGIADSGVACSWNSWMRSIVLPETAGRVLGKRFFVSTVAAIIAGLAAAAYIRFWEGNFTGEKLVWGYSLAIIFGGIVLGTAEMYAMSRMHEPRMPPRDPGKASTIGLFLAPLRAKNYRRLMAYIVSSNMAYAIVAPFLAVYLIKGLGVAPSAVLALGVLMQVAMVFSYRVWGPVTDQFGGKVVLSIAGLIFLGMLAGWMLIARPAPYFLTWPLVICLYVAFGVCTGGMNVAISAVRMKLSPESQATSFMMGTSMSGHLGNATGPIIGGLLAHYFVTREVGLPGGAAFLTLRSYDFVFLAAIAMGLATLFVLSRLQDVKTSSRGAVVAAIASGAAQGIRQTGGKVRVRFTRPKE